MLRYEDVPDSVRRAPEDGVYCDPPGALTLVTVRFLRSVRTGEQAAHYERRLLAQRQEWEAWRAGPDPAPRGPQILHADLPPAAAS